MLSLHVGRVRRKTFLALVRACQALQTTLPASERFVKTNYHYLYRLGEVSGNIFSTAKSSSITLVVLQQQLEPGQHIKGVQGRTPFTITGLSFNHLNL